MMWCRSLAWRIPWCLRHSDIQRLPSPYCGLGQSAQGWKTQLQLSWRAQYTRTDAVTRTYESRVSHWISSASPPQHHRSAKSICRSDALHLTCLDPVVADQVRSKTIFKKRTQRNQNEMVLNKRCWRTINHKQPFVFLPPTLVPSVLVPCVGN